MKTVPGVLKIGESYQATPVVLWASVGPKNTEDGSGGDKIHSLHITENGARIATHGIGTQGHDGEAKEIGAIRFEIRGEYKYLLLESQQAFFDVMPQSEEDALRAKLIEQARKKMSPAELAAMLATP